MVPQAKRMVEMFFEWGHACKVVNFGSGSIYQMSLSLYKSWCTLSFSKFFLGLRTVRYGTSNGSVEASWLEWTGQQGWCLAQNGETLRVGDVNGDGLYDLLCHDATGKTTLMHNQGGKSCKMIFSRAVVHSIALLKKYFLPSLMY